VGHFLDVVGEGLGGCEEGLEVGALPEALQVSFGRVPLDADDLFGAFYVASVLAFAVSRRG
jgi:hypothetical protein